jgi:hypothetical protein
MRTEWAGNTYRILVAKNYFLRLGVRRMVIKKRYLMQSAVNGCELDLVAQDRVQWKLYYVCKRNQHRGTQWQDISLPEKQLAS